MKTRVNLTIEDSLLNNIKAYASRKNMSVSELVENYFRKITKPSKRKNIIDVIDKMERPNIPLDKDLKKSYYEDQKAKYGF